MKELLLVAWFLFFMFSYFVQDLSLKQPSRQPDSKKPSREIPIPIQIVNAPYKQQQDHSRPSSATQSLKQLDPVVRPPSTQAWWTLFSWPSQQVINLKDRGFAAFLKICLLTIKRLLHFILLTYFLMSSKSFYFL